MRELRRERGFTLIETMAAVSVMLIGAVGIMGLFSAGLAMDGNARHMTRATAIAQDLLDNIALWPYQDNVAGTPLADTSTTNNGDIGDTGLNFQTDNDPLGDGLADHGEPDLANMGALWTGIPANTLPTGYERYWNVVYVDTNGNGVNDVVQIAVIVRWQQGGAWRRVVLLTAKLNPAGS
jgi:prepilin-type N-terminal cleavage/methylation domain-containing protein